MLNVLDKFSLKNKVALVTGASRGLGKAIAIGYASAGADVILLSRGKEALEKVAKEIENYKRNAWVFPFDLLQVDKIPEFFKKIVNKVGKIDILANVAGMTYRNAAVNFPLDEWHKVMELNTTSVFVLSQCFARSCIEKKRPGKIVNIASVLAEAARETIPAYTASKGAIKQLTKALAIEWAQYGINVNAIGPGYFETEITRPLKNDKKFNKWVLDKTPMKKWVQPEDLVGAAVFLASAASDYVTGHILYVDGGWLAKI